MGIESFRVELRGGKASYRRADEIVRKLPQVKLDQDSIPMDGSTYYLVDDGRHLVEIELMDAPIRLSCRFTLSHPPSVDCVFLAVVRELMSRLEMETSICDDVRPEHARAFSLTEFAEFSAVTMNYIAARRMEWVAAFGAESLAATTNEVFRRIILPQCQPGVERRDKTNDYVTWPT
jgi:hypothetical protein